MLIKTIDEKWKFILAVLLLLLQKDTPHLVYNVVEVNFLLALHLFASRGFIFRLYSA